MNLKDVYPQKLLIKTQKGFSMIELLVVLVIISTLFVGGVLNYRDYARKQTVTAAARQMESDIRLARQMAFEGKKPGGCGTLNGYIFKINSNNTYNIIARCDNVNDIQVKENVTFASGGLTLSWTPYDRIMFKSVGDGVLIPNVDPPPLVKNITVTITQDATSYNAVLVIGTSVDVTPP